MSSAQKLVIATRNRHKTEEIAAMLGESWDVSDLSSRSDLPDVEETASTFAGNSELKALTVSRWFPDAWVLADDSGLEVDALQGAPGVFSARYSGPGATDASNREKLLAELARVDARGKARAGRFRCVLTLARNGERRAQTEGAVEGIIGTAAKGDHGFGYDPLFIPEGYCETFGQLPSEVKRGMSHRARALAAMLEQLREIAAPGESRVLPAVGERVT